MTTTPPTPAKPAADSDSDNPLFGIMKMFGGGGNDNSDSSGMLVALVLFMFAAMMGKDGGGLGGLGDLFKGLLGGGDDGAGSPNQNAANATQNDLRQADTASQEQADSTRRKLDAAGLTIISTLHLGEAPDGQASTADLVKTANIDFPKAYNNIVFFNDKTGQYEKFDRTPSAQELEAAVENDKSRRFGIIDGKGEPHFFEQIAVASRDKSATGFASAAYRQIDDKGNVLAGADGKYDVWLSNPGYTGSLNLNPMDVLAGKRVTDATPQGDAVETVSNPGQNGYTHNLNPQDPEAVAFAEQVRTTVGADKVRGFITGSHSAGVSAMHVETAYLTAKGMHVTEVPLEQVGGENQIAALKEALADPNSPLRVKLAQMNISAEQLTMLQQHDFSKDFANEDGLRTVIKDSDGFHKTAMAQMPIGEGIRQALIDFKQGNNLGLGNNVAGTRREYLDVTAELPAGDTGLQASLDAHGIGVIFAGLRDLGQKTTLLEAGQTLNGSVVNVANANGAASQPALPGGPGAVRTPG